MRWNYLDGVIASSPPQQAGRKRLPIVPMCFAFSVVALSLIIFAVGYRLYQVWTFSHIAKQSESPSDYQDAVRNVTIVKAPVQSSSCIGPCRTIRRLLSLTTNMPTSSQLISYSEVDDHVDVVVSIKSLDAFKNITMRYKRVLFVQDFSVREVHLERDPRGYHGFVRFSGNVEH